VHTRFRGKPRSTVPKPLSRPEHWRSFIGNLASPANAPSVSDLPLITPAPGLVQAAAQLNTPFLLSEMATALHRLNNNRSPGYGSVSSEFFRYARYRPPTREGRRAPLQFVLLDVLTTLTNRVFNTGDVPAEWGRSLITPVHKRGSMLDTANYRPIAVGEPLSRLYALLLQARTKNQKPKTKTRCDMQLSTTIYHL
jgi:hypothetical protein